MDKFLAFDATTNGRALKMAHTLWGNGTSLAELAKEHSMSEPCVMEMMCILFGVSIKHDKITSDITPEAKQELGKYIRFGKKREDLSNLTPAGQEYIREHPCFNEFLMIDAYYRNDI